MATTTSSSVSQGTSSLDYYMQEATQALVHLMTLQSQNTQMQNQFSSQTVQVSENMSTQAADNAQKIAAAIEAQQHQSFFSKLFGEIAGALITLLGVVTADPAMAILGATMLVMQVSGGQDALNSALSGLPSWAQPLIMTAAAIVLAATIAGASTLIEALTTDTTEAAADGAANDAAAAAGGNGGGVAVGDDALLDLPDIGDDGVIAGGADAAGNGAAGAAGGNGAAGADAAAGNGAAGDQAAGGNGAVDNGNDADAVGNGAAAANNPQADLEIEEEIVEDAGSSNSGSSSSALGSAISSFSQATFIFNPFLMPLEKLLEKMGMSSEMAGIVAQALSMVLSMGGAVGGAMLSSGKGAGDLLKGFISKLSSNKATLFQGTLLLSTTAMSTTSSVYGVEAGVSQLTAAQYLNKKADIDAAQSIYQIILGLITQITNQSQGSFQGTMNMFESMNQNWLGYLSSTNYAEFMAI